MKQRILNPGHGQVVYIGYHPIYRTICFQEASDGHSFEGEHFTFELFHCSKDGEPDSPLDIDPDFVRSLPLPEADSKFTRSFLRFVLQITSEGGEA